MKPEISTSVLHSFRGKVIVALLKIEIKLINWDVSLFSKQEHKFYVEGNGRVALSRADIIELLEVID